MELTRGEKLKLSRERRHLTFDIAAKRVGVSPRTLRNWESDITKPDTEEIMRLAQVYHTSVAELLDVKRITERPRDAFDAPQFHTLPVIAKVPAKSNISFAEAKGTEYVEVKYNKNDHYCLTVTGRSMHPTMYEGDTLVVQVHEMALTEYDESEGPVNPTPWKMLHKRCVIASVNDEEPEVKRLFCYPRKDTGFKIMLQPDNRSVDPIEIDKGHTLVIKGVVRQIMRDPMNFE
jgi:SOS-response transcriptional repressor LexA